MSRSLGASLPEEIFGLLDGRDLPAREGLTILLLTASAEGWPQVAMLSVGEVLATSRETLRLALWPGSGTTANLDRTTQATLMLVIEGEAVYVRAMTRRLPDLSLARGPRAAFESVVKEVLLDSVGYAAITSGIKFQLSDRDEVLPAWQDAIEALRKL